MNGWFVRDDAMIPHSLNIACSVFSNMRLHALCSYLYIGISHNHILFSAFQDAVEFFG